MGFDVNIHLLLGNQSPFLEVRNVSERYVHVQPSGYVSEALKTPPVFIRFNARTFKNNINNVGEGGKVIQYKNIYSGRSVN